MADRGSKRTHSPATLSTPKAKAKNRGRGSAAAVLGAKGTGKGGDEESSSFHGLTSSDDEPVAPKAIPGSSSSSATSWDLQGFGFIGSIGSRV